MIKTRLWLDAIHDLIERHIALWRKAWSLRYQLDGENDERYEAPYLPSPLPL